MNNNIMRYNVTLSKINNVISKTYFANDGDKSERMYWAFLKERFPNCEAFWRYFVVPLTNRIVLENENQKRIWLREGISKEIEDIASFHFSIFLNLVYSYDHLQNFRLSSFEDFYMHLGSACDLAEEFLLKTYLLIIECTNQGSEILQKMTKNNFLKIAEEWFDDNYSKVYKNYLKKGKTLPIKLPSRNNVLDEYFNNQEDWKKYKKYTQKIREYRNFIVHGIRMGKILNLDGGIKLVPKKQKIQNYKRWSDVFAAHKDIKKLKSDFINMKEQMILDVGNLEIILNKLWDKPINDLKKLFCFVYNLN